MNPTTNILAPPPGDPGSPTPPGALTVRGLNVSFTTRSGVTHAVRDLDFDLAAGESLGIVGESGSGKTAAVLALMGLHDPRNTEVSGSALLGGDELIGAGEKALRAVRGSRISMIFQDALAALSPYHRIGSQLTEMYLLHHPDARNAEARARAVELLGRVGIPDPARRLHSYPHEFSGGMRQRVMIAMALMNAPGVVIADEPTTALDVTVQAQVLELLNELRTELRLSLIVITHDFGVVAEITDRTLVMYQGQEVEHGPTSELLRRPRQPYTKALVAAIPTMDTVPGSILATVDSFTRGAASAASTATVAPPITTPESAAPDVQPLLSVRSLTVSFEPRSFLFPSRARGTLAVDDVSFDIAAGESFGLVGESGCGKSTTSQTIVGLIRPRSGQVLFEGRDVTTPKAADRVALAKNVQIVFQDPYASLNPRRSVEQIVTAPLIAHTGLDRPARRERAVELLEQVGLQRLHLDRYPHEFSGGQRQRIGIARALALRPKLIVADEPVSALDVSIQAQVINLLNELRRELGVAYLFVSHDLTVVRHFCERVAVMRAGRIVETGTRDAVFGAPRHEYTKTLLSSIPRFRATRSEPGAR